MKSNSSFTDRNELLRRLAIMMDRPKGELDELLESVPRKTKPTCPDLVVERKCFVCGDPRMINQHEADTVDPVTPRNCCDRCMTEGPLGYLTNEQEGRFPFPSILGIAQGDRNLARQLQGG